PLPLARVNFLPISLANIKAVDGRAFFGGNLRQRDVQIEFGQGLRDHVQQAEVIFRFDVDDRPIFRRVVVEVDAGGDALPFERHIERKVGSSARDQSSKVNRLTGQRLQESRLGPFSFILVEVAASASVSYINRDQLV